MAYNVTGSQIIKNKIAIVTKELVLIMIKIYCKKIIAILINKLIFSVYISRRGQLL